MNQGLLSYPRGKLGGRLLGLPLGFHPDDHSWQIETLGADLSASFCTPVTVGASAKGNWAQLGVASFDADALIATPVQSGSTTARVRYYFDIGVGPPGSECVLVPDIWMGVSVAAIVISQPFFVPLGVKAGTRISVRGAGSSADVVGWEVTLMRSRMLRAMQMRKAWTIPESPDIAGMLAPSPDPNNSTNTKGPYLEIGRTRESMRAFYMQSSRISSSNLGSARNCLVDLAVGEAGQEEDILSVSATSDQNEDVAYPQTYGLYPFYAAAGTRFSVRSQCNVTNEAPHFGINLLAFG